MRTACSIFAPFHATTWPERRMRRGVSAVVEARAPLLAVRLRTSAFARSNSRSSISAASTITERSKVVSSSRPSAAPRARRSATRSATSKTVPVWPERSPTVPRASASVVRAASVSSATIGMASASAPSSETRSSARPRATSADPADDPARSRAAARFSSRSNRISSKSTGMEASSAAVGGIREWRSELIVCRHREGGRALVLGHASLEEVLLLPHVHQLGEPWQRVRRAGRERRQADADETAVGDEVDVVLELVRRTARRRARAGSRG